MDKDKSSELFVALVYSLQMQAMMNLGKIKNPMTEVIEKNLEAASVSIDMVDMLLNKAKEGFTEEETKVLEHIVSDLRLNYVNESGKELDKE
ncbi:MAG: DUF1844 domain-containing protein [Ignavibacteria bacterium]|nr:DUF1844 domain-containing protein [Ignavibacteriota bacterium]